MQVSIIMPAYNAEAHLAEAIESTLSQTHGDFEFILIDDGSSDATLSIAQGYAQRDRRMRVLTQENKGIAGTLNRAIELASNQWLARMDADDVMLPHRLARQIAFLHEHPDIDVLSAYVLLINESGRTIGAFTSPLTSREAMRRALADNVLVAIPHPAAMLRKAAVQALGGYRACFEPADDVDLWARLLEQRYCIQVMPEFLLKWRVHAGSGSVYRTKRIMLVTRFAQRCMMERRAGRPEPTWEQFLQWQHALPWTVRLAQFRADQAQVFYTAGAYRYSRGEYAASIGNLALSGALRPVATVRRAVRSLLRKRSLVRAGVASTMARPGRIRTLIFHPSLAPYRVDFFNELARHVDLKVVFLHPNLISQQLDQDALRQTLQCEHGFLLAGLDIADRPVRWGIGRTIRDFAPDVVIAPEFSPLTLTLALRKRLRPDLPWSLVLWTDDNPRLALHSSLSRRMSRRLAMDSAAAMVVLSEQTRLWHAQEGFQADRLFVSPLQWNEDRFRTLLTSARPVAMEYVQSRRLLGRRVALFVGRLVPNKRVDHAIAAFARIANDVPDALLVIVGDGPERALLLAQAANMGIADRVRFEGHQEGKELHAWYLLAQLFVLASRHEPYGAVVNEALLAGVPVLCSANAGAACLIREDANGNTFDFGNVLGLAGLMRRWLLAATPLDEGMRQLAGNLMPMRFADSVDAFVSAIVTAVPGGRCPNPNHGDEGATHGLVDITQPCRGDAAASREHPGLRGSAG